MATNPILLTISCEHLFPLDDMPLDVTKNVSVKKLLRILLYLNILSLVKFFLMAQYLFPAGTNMSFVL